MGDIHNLQTLISRLPLLNYLNEGPQNAAANGSQIIGIVEQRKLNRKAKSVNELSEAEKTEKEDERKRRLKKGSKQLIDLYG